MAVVCGLRHRVQGCEQLAVDAVHRATQRESHLYRDEVQYARLQSVSRPGAELQGDVQSVLSRERLEGPAARR